MGWYFLALRRIFSYRGRSRRKEFWYFYLFGYIVLILTRIVEMMLGLNTVEETAYQVTHGPGVLMGIIGIPHVLAAIAVQVRRLHDIDRSGFWTLIFLIPIVGSIVLLVFDVLNGTEGENRFGPDPLAEE